MTKTEILNVIAETFAGIELECRDEVIAYCEKEQAAIVRKNEKARERAAEKRTAGDEMRGRIEEILAGAEEPMTVGAIVDALAPEYADITPSKVIARMNQLVKAEKAGKEKVKTDGRTLVAYFLV